MVQAVNKYKRYERLYTQSKPLLSGSPSLEAQMATICALVYHKIPYISWAGFYLLKSPKQLYVASYQGPLACQKLQWPDGVCWSGILNEKAVIVADVSKFPGHIACDPRSKSEIVIPLKQSLTNKPFGVFDADSNIIGAFNDEDLQGLKKILSLMRI